MAPPEQTICAGLFLTTLAISSFGEGENREAENHQTAAATREQEVCRWYTSEAKTSKPNRRGEYAVGEF